MPNNVSLPSRTYVTRTLSVGRTGGQKVSAPYTFLPGFHENPTQHVQPGGGGVVRPSSGLIWPRQL